MPIRSFVRTAQGLATIAGRRGVGYVGYLLGGAAWPDAAYRFGWGPTAPPLLQGVFAAAGELAASKVDPVELRRLKLMSAEPAAANVAASPGEIERLMNRAHAAGITGVASSFGSLVRTADGTLAFGDLAKARKHHPSSVYFVASRDADRAAFNELFAQSIPTEALTRQTLREVKAPRRARRARKLETQSGGNVRPFAARRAGPGRSEGIVAPLVAGKRVLDLGSNDPSLPLMMLRAGAREVVAVEFTPPNTGISRLEARILSWRDVRPYDIQVLSGDMRLFLSEDLGTFDVVTALCSLYYLPEEQMAPIVQKAASMNAVLVLQADDTLDSLPAKTLALHRLLRDNGYPEVQVHTPEGLTRPLLVGYTWAGAGTHDRQSCQ